MNTKNSINKKLFIYLSGFVAFTVILLFILQTVALEAFYKSIKKNEIIKSADYIIKNYGNPDIISYVDKLSAFENMKVFIFDKDGNIVLKNTHRSQGLSKMTKDEVKNLYKVFQQGNSTNQFFIADGPQDITLSELNKNFRGNGRSGKGNEFLFYTQVSDDLELMVTIESMLTPVSATKSILRIQILYVSIILIISAGILAYILAQKISRPIIKINDSAKNLVKGDYNLSLDKSDYTEIIELNNTMLETSLELKKADKMQKDLIANISHDLRTPLTMIIGYAEVMRDIPDENNAENIQIIIDEATRLNNLVNDVLLISRLQNERQLYLKEVNITSLTQEIIDRAKKMIEKDNYNFHFDYLEEITIPLDEIKISQVIYNLLANAIAHTGDDKNIFIKQEIKNKMLRITISDTGRGIPKEEIPNIWERYYKVDKYHNRANVGTGLGLSIVKDIINAHCGNCGVDSELNKGSHFWFELPII